VPQPDDGEAVFGANSGLEHRLADQSGFSRQNNLRCADLLGRKSRSAFDGENVHSHGTERQFVEALSGQRRLGPYADALFATGKAVLLDPLLKARAAVRGRR
jgi:hypothetical protein